MAAAKKKPRIQAGEVDVGKRTLDNALSDMVEQIKENDIRYNERLALVDQRIARVEERIARAEELAATALQTIAAVSRDLQAMTLELRASNAEHRAHNARADRRLDALEAARA